jgi:hypothetical protein
MGSAARMMSSRLLLVAGVGVAGEGRGRRVEEEAKAVRRSDWRRFKPVGGGDASSSFAVAHTRRIL